MTSKPILLFLITTFSLIQSKEVYKIDCTENRLKCVIKSSNELLNIDICFFDRDMEELQATEIQIQAMTDVFISCHKLNSANLSGNFLQSLNHNIFHANPQLEIIILANNRITSLPPQIFDNLIKLRHLDLSRNLLRHLPVVTFKNQRQLKYLSLTENPLIELDVEQILNHTDHLHEIDITDTHLPCERLEQIHRVLQQANVSILMSSSISLNKDKNYDVTFVNASSCLNDEQMRYQATLNYPIDKQILKLLNDSRELTRNQNQLINRVLELESNFKFLEGGLLKIMREMRQEMNQLKISIENSEQERKSDNT